MVSRNRYYLHRLHTLLTESFFFMQEFFPIMSTIFTSVKGNEADTKIPLLFLQNDDDLAWWIKIEESYMNGTLPRTEALTSKRADTQRKPLAVNDFKPLYGLCAEDVNFLVGLVESKKVCIKSSRAKGASATLPTLQDAASREKLLQVMKNEMMCHYRGFHLPSKKPKYVPYTAVEWEGFAAEKKVTRAEVADWLDRALATVAPLASASCSIHSSQWRKPHGSL